MTEKATEGTTKKTFKGFDKLSLEEPFAKGLLNDIRNGMKHSKEGAYTISLDAGFGKGKTTFLEMFKNMIRDEKDASTSVEGNSKNNEDTITTTKNDAANTDEATNTDEAAKTSSNSDDDDTKYTIFSINAWETEKYGNPAVAILNEFIDFLRSDKKPYIPPEKKKALIEAAHLAKDLVISLAPSLSIPLTFAFGFIKVVGMFRKKEDDLPSTQSTTDKINQVISEYKEITKRDLIIVVDELDRVKPDYAVDFLESIKHFFDIPKICFLFAVNRQQLETTVRELFGKDLDFAGYYDKFFQREFSLTNAYSQAVKNYIQTEIEKFEQQPDIHFDKAQKNIDKWFNFYETFDLSLRQTQEWITISHKAFDKYIREILADERQFTKNREDLFDILKKEQLSENELKDVENELNRDIQRQNETTNMLVGKKAESTKLSKLDEARAEEVYSIDFYLVLFYTALYIKRRDLFTVETTQPIMEQHKKIHQFVEQYPNVNEDYLWIKIYLHCSLARKDKIFEKYAEKIISSQNPDYEIKKIDPELPDFRILGVDPKDKKWIEGIGDALLRFTIFDITPETLFNIISHP